MQEVHLSQLIAIQALRYGNRRALLSRHDDGWQEISWQALAQWVEQVACSLVAMQVGEGEAIAVFAPNMAEVLAVNFGAYAAGAVVVPFFPSSSPQDVEFMLRDASVKVLFVGGQRQYDTAFPLFARLSTLRKMVLLDKSVCRHPMDTFSLLLDEFIGLGRGQRHVSEVAHRRSRATRHALADILYTSGTTGRSKGVQITYGMYAAAFRNNQPYLKISEQDQLLSFLPLNHIFERAWTYLALSCGAAIAINRDPRQVLQAMSEVHPTAMCAVPRFWEKVYADVLHRAARRGVWTKAVLRTALRQGHQYHVYCRGRGLQPSLGLRLRYMLADRAVLAPIRKALGLERGRIFPVAGASLSPVVEGFLHSCGICMVAGYGLTETTATVSFDVLRQPFTLGSVGRVIQGMEVHIAQDGEILVRGEMVTKGYYRNPEETARALDADGWFHTGDAGYLKNGELYLTDRIKNLYKTSNGKYIAPQQVESALLVDRYIDQVMVIADHRRFVSALIVPDYELLRRYADRHGIKVEYREDMCRNGRILQFLQGRIDQLQARLADYQRVKRFILLSRPFSQERNELTNTSKMKRDVIFDHNIDAIEKMYRES